MNPNQVNVCLEFIDFNLILSENLADSFTVKSHINYYYLNLIYFYYVMLELYHLLFCWLSGVFTMNLLNRYF